MQIPKEQAKEKISQLIERFDDHIDEYKRGSYNETQTRVDYINPFFKALGWDIDNEQGLAEAYREVIHEDKIKIGKTTKAPDYCFTVYGQRKFFVDAKKPSINIKSDISPAYQVRRYGWSAKLSIAIVTDFEEFSIYDCSKKPNQNDRSSVARIQYLIYKDYLKEFDFIWETFSKERILKGSFDKFVQSDTKKRGTATVDNEFLKEIDEWRKYLATTIALRNKALGEDEINYAVQKTVDRILFLRICEDRGVEQYGNLKNAIKQGDLYKNLFEFFHIADEKYNSGLFDFKEDNITPNLIIDNKVIKNIIRELYYPRSPFEFSVLPADILGSVYEQFLGKTIRLTKAHQAKIEEKPEVRKAGGVYYTPKYIVDYIVENTVGKLINGKTPKQAEKIKICDPACGSGSFLIGAYQYLLDWHLKYYTGNPPKRKKDNPLTPDGNLTTAEKKRILLNNIYGVDIDPQAAEVTKLNLLLKALEGETQASISKQLTFFNERVLPNLGDNIKCGNSLIGNDFYDNQLDLFPNQIKKINAFDWENGFPEIFTKGGFDVVIGNPPYIQLSMEQDLNDNVKEYLLSRYKSSMGRMNTFGFFTKKGIDLMKDGCYLGFIIPNTVSTQDYYEELRNMILDTCAIESIASFEDLPFKDAVVENIILTLSKTKSKIERENNKVAIINVDEFFSFYKDKELTQKLFRDNTKSSFNINLDERKLKLKSKIEEGTHPMGDFLNINQAIALKTDRSKWVTTKKRGENLKPLLIGGKNINRYSLEWDSSYLIYDLEGIHSCKREDIFLTKEKIFFRRVSTRLIATLDNQQFYGLHTLVVMNKKPDVDINIRYFLGLFNSTLMNYYYKIVFASTKTVFSEIGARQVAQFPIKSIDFNNPQKKQTHNTIVKFVDNLLSLNKELKKAKLDTQRKQLQRTINHSESKIDELVYELYGLTKEEIKIIEQTT